jgi:hypothetical protein
VELKMKIRNIITAFSAVALASAALAQSDPIVTQSTSESTSSTKSDSTTKVYSPPPSAISPSITVINNDVCVTASSGAVQTQIFGLSLGVTERDYNCERLKLARSLYDMGMKVAAVAVMCQDRRVFDSMMAAGTPCPVDGKIGAEAKAVWDANPDRIPQKVKSKD